MAVGFIVMQPNGMSKMCSCKCLCTFGHFWKSNLVGSQKLLNFKKIDYIPAYAERSRKIYPHHLLKFGFYKESKKELLKTSLVDWHISQNCCF